MSSRGEVEYSLMGIFPEIKRVWITQDTKLYLWDYGKTKKKNQKKK